MKQSHGTIIITLNAVCLGLSITIYTLLGLLTFGSGVVFAVIALLEMAGGVLYLDRVEKNVEKMVTG